MGESVDAAVRQASEWGLNVTLALDAMTATRQETDLHRNLFRYWEKMSAAL